MGGFGSGKGWRMALRENQFHRVELASFHRERLMRAGIVGNLTWSRGEVVTSQISYTIHQDHIAFRWYAINGHTKTPHCHNVYFDYTAQHLGGHRRWFLCPKCSERCSVLFLRSTLACRKCWRLVYDCQYEAFPSTPFKINDRNRRTLGGEAGLANCFPSKPKNMHWQTYYKLRDYDCHTQKTFKHILTAPSRESETACDVGINLLAKRHERHYRTE